MKGLSYQTTMQYGGLFSRAGNFDPFKRTGSMSPTPVPAEVGAAQISKVIRYIAPGQVSGTNFMFGWADDGSDPALYKTNSQTGATTDESANVTTTSSKARGAIVYGGYLLYARNTEIRSVLVGMTGDTQILTTNVTSAEHPFTIGADLNIYFPNGNYVGKIDHTTGLAATTGNDAQAFAMEPDMNIRHLVNDGRYLVIIADNAGQSTDGNVNCVVAYWDMSSTTLVQRFDFQDSGLTAGVLTGNGILVFGKDYLYITSVSTFPRSIMPFIGSFATTAAPTSPAQVSKQGDMVYWASGIKVYGYGNIVSGAPKIFFQPYTFNAPVAAFIQTGIIPYGSTTGSDFFGVGISPATNQTATIATSQITLPVPFKFEWARITMRSKLSSGVTVGFTLNCQGGAGAITGESTFSFAAHGAKQTHVFRPSGGGATTDFFDEFSMTLSSNETVEKIEIWGTRGDDQQEIQ